MGAERKPSLRRKPLSDCTNSVVATSRRNSPSPQPKSAVSATVAIAISATNKSEGFGENVSPNLHTGARECKKFKSHGTQNRKQAAKPRKNEGKMEVETIVIQTSNVVSETPVSSSRATGIHTCPTSAVQGQKADEQRSDGTRNKDLDTPNTNGSDPSTPLIAHAFSSVLGSDEESLNLSTFLDQMRKHAGVEIALSMSWPCEKRRAPDDDDDAKQSDYQMGCPPVHKKRPRRKHEGSPEEDVEKLKAYYADIDAFELPVEEVTSERDLE